VFSPDGTILFRSYEHDDTKESDYWTVRPDGKDLTQLKALRAGHARSLNLLLARR
jgi:hypothetical protein